MVTYEYAVFHFTVGDDWTVDSIFLGSFDDIQDAEKFRSDYLDQFKAANPQNVQVIQLVF